MTEGRLWSIACALRPGIKRLEGAARTQAMLEVLPAIFTGPLAVFALVALALVTDVQVIADHMLLLAALFAALLIIGQHSFYIQVEMPNGRLIPIQTSLSAVIEWSAALLFGPTVLWLSMLARGVVYGEIWWARRRLSQGVRWIVFALFCQEAGGSLFANLVGLGVYRGLGGSYPLAGLQPHDWLPAVIGALPTVLLPPLVLLPVVLSVDLITGQDGGQSTLLRWWGALVVLGLVTEIPFATLGALIYTEAGVGLYLLFAVGILLVNYLAHHLSRSNLRSQQRTRELARLEALGEALIQAPANLCTLQAVLAEHVESMFPGDRFEIRLFEPDYAVPAGVDWPTFRLTFPLERPPVDDAAWDDLRACGSSHMVVKRVIPPGLDRVFGEALLVRIAADDPGQEGGAKEKLLGGIGLLRNKSGGKVIASLPALQALASQIGSAYYRAQVHVETLAAQKMSQELDLAGRIQARFLPREVPVLPGWELVAALIPARQTSGDFYDFVPLPGDRLGLVVADVADKGTAAALYMALSRTLIRGFAMQYPDAPEEALRAANERLLTDAESDQFVTVFYGVLDPATGSLTYASAGHNRGYVLRGADGGRVDEMIRTGVPLGMFERQTWTQRTIALVPGDVLLLYTDGVSEAQDPAGALFGEDRMLGVAQAYLRRPAADLHGALVSAVVAHAGSAPQFDDITLLVAARR